MSSNGLACEAPGLRQPVLDLEERAWLARHCRGDQAAFPALLAAYRRPVYTYLVRAGVAPADRDDLFQSVFLKIHAAAASYDPARPLAPWVFTIVANTARNHFRARRPDQTPPSHREPPDVADPQPGPDRVVQARQTVAWLERAVAALPAAQREVLVMTTVLELRQHIVHTTTSEFSTWTFLYIDANGNINFSSGTVQLLQ